MSKIGRNQPCPCGSGKKHKYCCGKAPSVSRLFRPTAVQLKSIQQRTRQAQAAHVQRQRQQGLGKPILSAEASGQRIVAVGNQPYAGAWKTFHDFLGFYIGHLFGRAWFEAEDAKPAEQRHPTATWRLQSIDDSRRYGKMVGDIVGNPMTGAQRAFLNLAYNLYLIAHHASPAEAGAILEKTLRRLKSSRNDDFIGKLFETYAAAAFLKAGFQLSYEDEVADKATVEFVATYPSSGKRFSVEVKARNRNTAADGPVDEIKRLRVANKLNAALKKDAEHTRIVMIEINVPDQMDNSSLDGWPRAALEQIKYTENQKAPDGTEKQSAYVIVTNHAFHNNLTAVGVGAQALATGFKIPDFGPDVAFNSLKAVLASEQSHQEAFALMDSIRTHYEIPVTFDGSIHNVDTDAEHPPLKFGRWYRIPIANGGETDGLLYEAIVDESQRKIYGVYETLAGGNVTVTTPMTEAEIEAWKRHPDTFFGEVRDVPGKADNWLELAKFFYENHRDTPREKLLEWMKDAPDLSDLQALSQPDLVIAFCERSAFSAERQQRPNQDKGEGDHRRSPGTEEEVRRDKYKNFEDLRANEAEARDFEVRVSHRPGSTAIIAPHGGGIEKGTSEIADAIAADMHSLYCFEGVKSDNNWDLHITSTNFDEPRCLQLIQQREVVVAVHGLEGVVDRVDVGGRDTERRDQIAAALTQAGFAAVVVTEGQHAALNASNICNRGSASAGVQLEITRSLRDSLRTDEGRLQLFGAAVQRAIGG